MSLGIKILYIRNTNVFYGGEEVSGFVEATGPMRIPMGKLDFKFDGVVQTWQQKSGKFPVESTIELFSTTETLFEADLELADGAVRKWPFKVRLPVDTDASTDKKKIRYSRKEPYQKGAHKLPPSAAMSGKSPYPWQAHVVYRVEATIKGRPGMKYHLGAINVVPRPSQTQDGTVIAEAQLVERSHKFTHKSSRLLEGQAERRRSVAKWFGDKVGSDTPCAVFTITAQTAQTLIPGGGLPIQLKLEFNANESNLPALPPVRLLEIEYRIWATTNVLSRNMLTTEINVTSREKVYARRMHFESFLLDVGETAKFGIKDPTTGAMNDLSFDAPLIPPFTTYNIGRSYDLEIQIAIECGGKKMSAKFKWDPLVILFNEHHSRRHATQFKDVEEDLMLEGGKLVLKTALNLAQNLLQN